MEISVAIVCYRLLFLNSHIITIVMNGKGCSGAPDWIIKIASPSNPRHDYILKLNLYNSAGVREYWIVDPKYSKIIVCNMETEDFTSNTYSFSDTVKAGIYEDLYIDFSGMDI